MCMCRCRFRCIFSNTGFLSSGQRRRRRQLATLQGLTSSLDRYGCLTRYSHLTQPATITLELISLGHILPGAGQVLSTLLFVVAGFGNGTDRATVNAFAAGTLSEKEAIGPVVGVRSGGRLNRDLGNYGTRPHGRSLSAFPRCVDATPR
jgi:hypothetical protein